MDSISTRNSAPSSKKFLPEITTDVAELVTLCMPAPIPRRIYMDEWLNFFSLGPTEAARIAGCSQGFISNIGRQARSNVNVLYLLALSEHLGISVNDFFVPPPRPQELTSVQRLSSKGQQAVLARARDKG